MKLIKWFSLENRIPIKKALFLTLLVRNWVLSLNHDWRMQQVGSEKTLSYLSASSPPSSVRLHLFNPGFSSCCFPGRQGLIANNSPTVLPPCASTLGLVPISHPQVCGEWTGNGDYQQRGLRGLSAAINRSKNAKYQNAQTFGRALTGEVNPAEEICGLG